MEARNISTVNGNPTLGYVVRFKSVDIHGFVREHAIVQFRPEQGEDAFAAALEWSSIS
jgi:hypothetical protein